MKIFVSAILSMFLFSNILNANCPVIKLDKGCNAQNYLSEVKNTKVIVEDKKGNVLANVSIISGRDGKEYKTNTQGECEIPLLRKNDELTFILDGFKTSVLIFETEIYSSTIYYQLTKGKKNKREVKYYYDPLRKRP